MNILKYGAAISGSIMLLSVHALAASDNQAAWNGFMTVTARTAACGQIGGTSLGDTAVSVYRPKIAASDTATFLSQFYTRFGVTFQNSSESTTHQMRGSGKYLAHTINPRAKAFTYNGTYQFTVTPAKVVASTPYLTITGMIKSFLNTPGCNVSFKGTYVKML